MKLYFGRNETDVATVDKVITEEERFIAIQTVLLIRLKKLRLTDFEPQAQQAAFNQFKRDNTSAHRAIQAGINMAKDYRRHYIGEGL